MSVDLYLALVALLYVERGVELLLSSRNARWALARGGRELYRADYAVMVAVHAVFPLACAIESRAHGPAPVTVAAPALFAVLVAQSLRYWAIASLGRRWNTRIVVLPGVAPVVRGPYRFLKHPNYLAVVLELLAFPLVGGAWICAIGFSLANALLLWRRIPAEERALGPEYQAAFANRSRFIPEVGRDR